MKEKVIILLYCFCLPLIMSAQTNDVFENAMLEYANMSHGKRKVMNRIGIIGCLVFCHVERL